MKAERSAEAQLIEELVTIGDTEANLADGRTDMIPGLVAAECGLTIPGA